VVKSVVWRLVQSATAAVRAVISAVNAAIARFEKRQKIDRDFQKKFKKVAKKLKFDPSVAPEPESL